MEVRRPIGFRRLGITQKFVFKDLNQDHGSATADCIPPFGDNVKVNSEKKKIFNHFSPLRRERLTSPSGQALRTAPGVRVNR